MSNYLSYETYQYIQRCNKIIEINQFGFMVERKFKTLMSLEVEKEKDKFKNESNIIEQTNGSILYISCNFLM